MILSIITAIVTLAFNAAAQAVSIQLQSDYATGSAAGSPRYAVGDVNNDRLPDLVILNKANSTEMGPIAVFLNNGAGGFAAPINITSPTITISPNAVAIGDYNEDGHADLAIAKMESVAAY